MKDRCPHCPVTEGTQCRGLVVTRFCELIDPECDRYDPGYRDVIVRASSELPPRDPYVMGSLDAAANQTPQVPTRRGCCGGG